MPWYIPFIFGFILGAIAFNRETREFIADTIKANRSKKRRRSR